MNIFINDKQWKKFDDETMNRFKEEIFNHYREHGFPYYILSDEDKRVEFEKLQNVDFKRLLSNDIVSQTMHGLSLAWSYFPHSWSIKCNDLLTPMDLFNDDILFKKVIEKRLKMGTYISDSGIRKMLKIFTGTQSVSNFRPSAAGAIYEHYAGDGVVYDMSSGFGGRLLGAITSNRVKRYIGVDPSTKTYDGLMNIHNDFIGLHNKDVEIYKIGSEDFHLNRETVDLCFTSPPYFNTEKYSDEETQSYMKYTNYDKWIEKYLGQTFQNCFDALKTDGYLIVNIANTKRQKNMELDMLNTAKSIGFLHQRTLKLALSSLAGGGYKYEPIFVLQKMK